ncbi:MAG: phosphate ABC transporter permease PstA [Synechococcaceae cyanobacterium RL_1_2]|nr:phosphate ABC transporter permease PstA [Synechococcaceae cyanobacterium RL_1_2]
MWLRSNFAFFSWLSIAISIVVLALLLYDIVSSGWHGLNWTFLTSPSSYRPSKAGIDAAIVGTMIIMVIVAVVTFPLGVGAGIFLEEFSEDNWLTRLIEININNLAGVPSIIYGMLGLFVFARLLEPLTGGKSLISGGLTLGLLVLPVIIVATREALRAVPDSLRHAGLALGATKWQVVWSQILPEAFPGILTGTILALSRAIGETAPLLVVGAKVIVPLPRNLQDSFTVLPIQIFNWVGEPKQEFHDLAASAIIVLLVLLLVMNFSAVVLRNKFQTKH